jgi:hypothetical protein
LIPSHGHLFPYFPPYSRVQADFTANFADYTMASVYALASVKIPFWQHTEDMTVMEHLAMDFVTIAVGFWLMCLIVPYLEGDSWFASSQRSTRNFTRRYVNTIRLIYIIAGRRFYLTVAGNPSLAVTPSADRFHKRKAPRSRLARLSLLNGLMSTMSLSGCIATCRRHDVIRLARLLPLP